MDKADLPITIESINIQCCCLNMRKVARAITQLYDRYLEQANIRSTQFNLLVALDTTKAKTLTEIANSLVMDRTTLTRNLKPLEKLNFITTNLPLDKRSKGYILTPQGKAVVELAIPLWQEAQKILLLSMDEAEHVTLFSSLDKLLKVVSGAKKSD